MNENAEVRDPVCGKQVDPLRARAVGIFGGVTHYFCSPECKAKFSDPRALPSDAPEGVERRWADDSSGSVGASREWFERGKIPQPMPKPERFTDLDRAAPPVVEVPPSPSIMIEVAAVKRSNRIWLWIFLMAAAGGVLLWLGLRG